MKAILARLGKIGLTTTEAIIAMYRTRAATTWPGLRDVLVYALDDQHPMVVEGYQLEPGFVSELLQRYPTSPIRSLFLSRMDQCQLTIDLQRSTHPDDWVRRSATQASTFERIATMVCVYSCHITQETQHWGLPLCEMDGPQDERLAHAIEMLFGSP